MSNVPTAVTAHLIDAFREQEVEDLFGFFFVSTADPTEMRMQWAYGNGANWTGPRGVALLERVIEIAQEALVQAKHEVAKRGGA